ncbi:hypothetical protein TPAU25S_03548 [Tsukamurella paurometabola]|uniref:DUF5313 domain-containing protein n=1 Tax=Tsukamurella paurometabola (strain ATCC 8368 / DSM 20162 / CCUG 35730 / CIP 100753 / JCM 10117 / KCTC 9821 / NBRC 16120 / NCIMB 702349 / NCTC 13040) TaxID=521096 RepID=D5UPX0_TSUPD|nr:DUF5313 domain-containing protein [Tsukamurella paurometabola]ADG76738.1 conserved hypothetical protein [Tsukamurella paurometabola DSM 20162]SUP41420.1 Uncharacterised protein [Tsukamurella paurometabola]
MTESPTKPNPVQYLLYSYGKTLPASMRDWVAHDLAGAGAGARTVIRFSIPCVLMLVPFWFVDADFLVKATMTLPIFIPFVYFSIALNKIYRRARLRWHGLDPDLVDQRARIREADLHREYLEKYGPRDR